MRLKVYEGELTGKEILFLFSQTWLSAYRKVWSTLQLVLAKNCWKAGI